jgi:AcrR family transcriptional regulator
VRVQLGVPAEQSKVAPENTSELLLRLGAELFAERGYAGASMRQLADRLGLTTGAIYANFRNKADLMLAIINDRLNRELEDFGIRRLPEYVGAVVASEPERVETRALLLEAAAASRSDPNLRERLNASHRERLDSWTRDYEAWQRSARVDPSLDMGVLLRLLWAIELGTGVLEALQVERPRRAGRRSASPATRDRSSMIVRFLSSLENTASGSPRRRTSRRQAKS